VLSLAPQVVPASLTHTLYPEKCIYLCKYCTYIMNMLLKLGQTWAQKERR